MAGVEKAQNLSYRGPFRSFIRTALGPGIVICARFWYHALYPKPKSLVQAPCIEIIYIREIVVARLNTVSFTLGKTHIYYAYEF